MGEPALQNLPRLKKLSSEPQGGEGLEMFVVVKASMLLDGLLHSNSYLIQRDTFFCTNCLD